MPLPQSLAFFRERLFRGQVLAIATAFSSPGGVAAQHGTALTAMRPALEAALQSDPKFLHVIDRYGPQRPLNVIGRGKPAKLSGVVPEGFIVQTLDGGTQIIQFNEIWRIRLAFASDEPAGAAVVDFANNRIFVAANVDELVKLGQKPLSLAKFTSPSGSVVYLSSNKVTDIFAALPGLHNPESKTVVGTRDGMQQVKEPLDAANQIVTSARSAQ